MTRPGLFGLAILSFLAACDLADQDTFRDQEAPISASTRFDRETFAGTWRVVERFGANQIDQIVFEAPAGGDGVTVSGTGLRGVDGTYRVGVPGELIPTVARRDPLVVMWIDETGETAAIGTASGSFGALIDRNGRVPPDKALAARGIFEFYGWDTGQLKGTGV